MSAEEMKQQRKQAAHRQRRIIFNDDGWSRMIPATTPEELLEAYTPRLGSHVDSIFYCTAFGFNLCSHNSDVSEVFVGDAVTEKFIEQGTDALEIMVDYCHQHNVEIFWSMRVNDQHDSYGHAGLMSQFKKDHPEYLFGSPEKRPPHGPWTGVDYAEPEIREQAFRIIEDVCQRYDIDGIELDFFRQLANFKRLVWGEALGQEERDMMTGLLRRVRTMTEEVAQNRGRPLLFAVRVPDSVEYSRALGLDWQEWLAEDLIDILVVGGYFQLSPWEETVELGHKYNVPVYPCLSESRMGDSSGPGAAKLVRNSQESYRARAMDVWNAGADGIYLFNFHYDHPPDHPIWSELGDSEILQKLDKLYHVSVMGYGHASVNRYLPGGDQFLRVPTLSPENPVTLEIAESYVTTLTLGDNVLWGKAAGVVPELKLALRVEHLYYRGHDLSVKLNGHALSTGVLQLFKYGWLEYTLDPALVQTGANSLEIEFNPWKDAGRPIVIEDIQLQINYKNRGFPDPTGKSLVSKDNYT